MQQPPTQQVHGALRTSMWARGTCYSDTSSTIYQRENRVEGTAPVMLQIGLHF